MNNINTFICHIMSSSGNIKACGLDGICDCDNDFQKVDCTGRNLKYLPTGIPLTTRTL